MMQEIEKDYVNAWEALKNARLAYEMAQRNFYEIAGIMMEQLMLDNVDVLARLKNGDAPTI